MLFQQTLFYFNNFYFLFILQLVSSCEYHNNNYWSYEANMYSEIHYTSEIALSTINFSYIRKKDTLDIRKYSIFPVRSLEQM